MDDDQQPRGNDGPLVPGMLPMDTRVLAVGGDPARLHLIVTNLELRGYQVTSSTDPAAAMAALRQDSLQGRLSFDVVMVDRSEYTVGARAAAGRLFEFAVREPQLSAYGIKENDTFGPLAMEDLNEFMKPIYTFETNGPKSPKATPNGLYNTSPSTATSTITNFLFSGRSAGRRSKKQRSDTDSEEVEQDEEHAESERQQPSQNPKKARIVWTDELHKKFMAAYNKLEPEDRVPNKILDLMKNEYPTLTREHIASHLQKHRLNIQRQKCRDSRRKSHSRTNQRSTPQASFPSPNISSQQQAPPAIMQPDLSATVHINYCMNARTMPEAPVKSDTQDSCLDLVIHMQTFKATDKSSKSVLVDVPPKEMHPGADDPKHNGVCCVGNSDDNSLPEHISKILNEDPGPSWDAEFL